VEQWHCCNPSSAIDPHQVLAWWFFVIIAGLSAQCVNTSWLWGATSSPDGTDTVLENSTPFCKGTLSLTMLVCTFYWPWCLKAKTKVNLLFVLLTCRFEENLSSPPLYEHSTELAEITTSYKVWWLLKTMCNEMSNVPLCTRALNSSCLFPKCVGGGRLKSNQWSQTNSPPASVIALW